MVGYIIVAVQAMAVVIGIACRDWVREEWQAWKRAGEFLERIERLDKENEAANHHLDMN